jgi:hypothetical protein
MMTSDTDNGIQREIAATLDELQAGLDRASRAAAAIREMLPRVGALGALFDELEAVVRSGREQIGIAAGASIAAETRPTLLIPTGDAPPASTPEAIPGIDETGDEIATSPISSDLISVRIEFESAKAPLELRIIDEAVGEHPAVRDVALLDYDGRRATLKVWIDPATSPGAIEESLRERLPELIGDGGTITITALDNAA